jgi:hypothetical protein
MASSSYISLNIPHEVSVKVVVSDEDECKKQYKKMISPSTPPHEKFSAEDFLMKYKDFAFEKVMRGEMMHQEIDPESRQVRNLRPLLLKKANCLFSVDDEGIYHKLGGETDYSRHWMLMKNNYWKNTMVFEDYIIAFARIFFNTTTANINMFTMKDYNELYMVRSILLRRE